MEASLFIDSSTPPSAKDLECALGGSYKGYAALLHYVLTAAPGLVEEWHFSKFGWNLRVRDKKRVIVYLMPGEQYYNVSFVFGRAAVEKAIASNISESVKETIMKAKVYAEGRGFRLHIVDSKCINDLTKLVEIKLAS